MMKSLAHSVLFLAFLFMVLTAKAQLNRDSLFVALAQAQEDSTKVFLLLSIGEELQSSLPDSSRYYGYQALRLSRKIDFYNGLHKSFRNIAYTHVVQSEYDSTLYYAQLGQSLAQSRSDTFNLGIALFNIGIVYRFKGDLENAVYYSLEGTRLLDGKGYTHIESALYDGLQVLHMSLAQYDLAIQYGEKACAIGRSMVNKNSLVIALSNLSLNYMEVDRLSDAKKVLHEAIDVSRKIDNKSVEAAALNNLASIALRENDLHALEKYAKKALSLNLEIESTEGIASAKRNLAIYFMNQLDFAKATTLAREALELTRNNSLSETSECLKVLASLHFAKGDFAQATQYMLESSRLDGRIFNESLKEKESMYKVKFETAKKELQIEELQARSRVDQLTLKNRTTFNYILIGSAVTIIAISLLSVRTFRQKQKLHQNRIAELETEKQLSTMEAVLKGEEQERARIAKDLHDGLGGLLSGMKHSFHAMKGNLVMTVENQHAFQRSMDMLDSSIMEMRRVAHNMMPESLLRFGLDTALKDFCADINHSGALQLSYQSIGIQNNEIDRTTAITIYRIVQELLNNILKHASSRTALVQVTRRDGMITVTVEDDGKGFDIHELETSKGMGWTNIRHRVDFLKGRVEINSSPGMGTSVQIEFNV